MTRRPPVVDNQWYASLTRDNVELVTTPPIERLTEGGVQTSDGTVRDADLIIALSVSRPRSSCGRPSTSVRTGVSLEEVWKVQGAQAHLGMTVPGFPNLFMLYGPNSQPVASGAGLPIWLETWCGYIAEGDPGDARKRIRVDGDPAGGVRPLQRTAAQGGLPADLPVGDERDEKELLRQQVGVVCRSALRGTAKSTSRCACVFA